MQRVYLRALEIGDLDNLYKWHNNQELYRFVVRPFHFVSHASELEWLQKKQTFSMNEISLAICKIKNDEHIGNVYLTNIDWVSRCANMGFFIGDAGERKIGYGAEAGILTLRFAFMDLGLNRIWASVLEENTYVIEGIKKLGFIVEGRMRKHVFKEGVFKDVVILGLCASDIPPRLKKLANIP